MDQDEISALLNALSDGIEARAVGLFDARHAAPGATGTLRTSAFWDTFIGLKCLNVDWRNWDRALTRERRAFVRCACGEHSVEAFLVHERLALVVLAAGVLMPGAPTVISHAVKILAELIPASGTRGWGAPPWGVGGGRGDLGIPTWWARRRQPS